MGVLKLIHPKVPSSDSSSAAPTAAPSPALTALSSPSHGASSPASSVQWLDGSLSRLNSELFELPEAVDPDHDFEDHISIDFALSGFDDAEVFSLAGGIATADPPLRFIDVANEWSLPGHAATGEWARSIAPRPHDVSPAEPLSIRCSSAGLILEPTKGWSDEYVVEMEKMNKLDHASKTRGDGAPRPRKGRSRSPNFHVEPDLVGQPRGRAPLT